MSGYFDRGKYATNYCSTYPSTKGYFDRGKYATGYRSSAVYSSDLAKPDSKTKDTKAPMSEALTKGRNEREVESTAKTECNNQGKYELPSRYYEDKRRKERDGIYRMELEERRQLTTGMIEDKAPGGTTFFQDFLKESMPIMQESIGMEQLRHLINHLESIE